MYTSALEPSEQLRQLRQCFDRGMLPVFPNHAEDAAKRTVECLLVEARERLTPQVPARK